jgi:hypothetical protein
MTEAIIIAGNGTTTRANVEALIDDYFYANKKLKVYIAVNSAISEGQIWAAQYAVDNEISVIAYMTQGAKMTGLPLEATRQNDEDPVRTALQAHKDVIGFLLWNDEDVESLNALGVLDEYGIQALDLTNGLATISSAKPIKQVKAPEIPQEEQVVEPEPEPTPEPEVEEYEDPLYEAIRTIAGIFAEELAEKLAEVLRK